MLRYRESRAADPFYWIYSSPGWLTDYDPPRAFPFWLNVELTNRCQLDCIFCSRQTSRRPLGDMDMATARAIIDEAARFNGEEKTRCALRLTGWGEPLLHPKAGEIIAMAKAAGLPIKIYTNGLALTPALMDTLIECGADDLQFSLQGLTPGQYAFNRRRSNYAKVRANVEMAHQRRGGRPRPFISVLTSVLADEARSASAEDFMADWLTLADKVAIDLTNLNFVSGVDRVKPYLKNQSAGLSRGKCVDVFLALEVKYDGLIQFCGQDADGRPEHSLGRVGEMSLKEAWDSPRMEGQRERVGRHLGHGSMAVCRNCYHNTDKYEVFKKGD